MPMHTSFLICFDYIRIRSARMERQDKPLFPCVDLRIKPTNPTDLTISNIHLKKSAPHSPKRVTYPKPALLSLHRYHVHPDTICKSPLSGSESYSEIRVRHPLIIPSCHTGRLHPLLSSFTDNKINLAEASSHETGSSHRLPCLLSLRKSGR